LIDERIQFSSEVSSGPAFRAVRCLSRATQAAHLRIMRTAVQFVQIRQDRMHCLALLLEIGAQCAYAQGVAPV